AQGDLAPELGDVAVGYLRCEVGVRAVDEPVAVRSLRLQLLEDPMACRPKSVRPNLRRLSDGHIEGPQERLPLAPGSAQAVEREVLSNSIQQRGAEALPLEEEALGLFWHDHTLRQVLATRCERERASFIDGCEQSEPLDWRAICVEHARSPSGRERCVAACGELLELRAVDVAADHPVRAATLRV